MPWVLEVIFFLIWSLIVSGEEAKARGEAPREKNDEAFSDGEHSLLRSTLGERFVIFGDPVVDGIPVHARREESRFLVTWTGDVQNLRHFE